MSGSTKLLFGNVASTSENQTKENNSATTKTGEDNEILSMETVKTTNTNENLPSTTTSSYAFKFKQPNNIDDEIFHEEENRAEKFKIPKETFHIGNNHEKSSESKNMDVPRFPTNSNRQSTVVNDIPFSDNIISNPPVQMHVRPSVMTEKMTSMGSTKPTSSTKATSSSTNSTSNQSKNNKHAIGNRPIIPLIPIPLPSYPIQRSTSAGKYTVKSIPNNNTSTIINSVVNPTTIEMAPPPARLTSKVSPVDFESSSSLIVHNPTFADIEIHDTRNMDQELISTQPVELGNISKEEESMPESGHNKINSSPATISKLENIENTTKQIISKCNSIERDTLHIIRSIASYGTQCVTKEVNIAEAITDLHLRVLSDVDSVFDECTNLSINLDQEIIDCQSLINK